MRRVYAFAGSKGDRRTPVDLDALGGAQIGVNLLDEDGNVVNAEDILNKFVQVARQQGGIVGDLTTDIVYEGGNLYFTNTRARLAVGDILEDSDNVTLTFTPGDDPSIVADLTTTGVAAGTYGDSGHIPQITVDDRGRVVAITLIAVGLSTSIVLLLEDGDFLTTEAGDHLGGNLVA